MESSISRTVGTFNGPHPYVKDGQMNSVNAEAPLDSDIAIVDAHHHLGAKIPQAVADALSGGRTTYLIDEYLDDVQQAGHNVVASAHVDGESMYRASGPASFRVTGETEFIAGQAAMSDSGLYGSARVAAAIVGRADLSLGDEVRPVLEQHVALGNGRFRGVRQTGAWDEDTSVLGHTFDVGEHLYLRDDFRRGFAHLVELGLTFDAFVLAPQLHDVLDLALAFPESRIVLDHTGQPVGRGRFTGRREDQFEQWRQSVDDLAGCSNVSIKLGGLGSFIAAFDYPPGGASSLQLAEQWGPYITAAIEAFGPSRCMFESNYPVDHAAGTFGTIWNTFQRITASYTDADRHLLFSGTAAAFYNIPLAAEG